VFSCGTNGRKLRGNWLAKVHLEKAFKTEVVMGIA